MNILQLGGIVFMLCFGVLFGVGGVTNINPGEVGILVKMVGDNRGMQSETLDTGMRWVNPFTYDVVVYDTRIQQYTVDDLISQTKDGQPISVDVSLEVGLADTKVPGLHEQIGPAWWDRVVFPALRSEIRNNTSTQLSDVIYTGAGRSMVQEAVQKSLRSRYEPFGINISVNLRDVDFTNEQFVKTLEDKAEAAQKVIIAERQAEQAEQDAIKVANAAEGEKQKRIKAAEAQREELRLNGEGSRLQKEEEAKGILAVATAQAEGTRLMVNAYGDGGTYASVRWAETMGPNVKVLGYPLGAPGTTGLFNVDGILGDALKVKEAAK